jgi:hypothetical protein
MIPVNVLDSISVAHYASIHLFLITLPACATGELFRPTVLERSCGQLSAQVLCLGFNELSSFPSLFAPTQRPRLFNTQLGSLLAHSTNWLLLP